MTNASDRNRPPEEPVRRDRRAFLRGIPGAGLTAGAVLAGGSAATAQEAPEADPETGFADNDYIRRYYQLSRS